MKDSLMFTAKNMRRLLLALLLPVLGVLAHGRAVALPEAAGIVVVESFQAHRGSAEIDGNRYYSNFHFRTPRLSSSSGIRLTGSSGGENHSWGGPFHDALPASFALLPNCSKAFLKEHLRALLGHFTYQQRLALYPKHWFW